MDASSAWVLWGITLFLSAAGSMALWNIAVRFRLMRKLFLGHSWIEGTWCLQTTEYPKDASIAAGRSVGDLLADFPDPEERDIREALAYAAGLAQGREFPLAS